jgi:predicted transcriptional regulator
MIDKLANRFQYLDTLIRKRATGTPKELAERLGITERAWYKIRDELIHDLNVPLAYDSQRQTYYYTEAGQFMFGFCRSLTTSDMEELKGGWSVQTQPEWGAFGLSYALNW